MYTDYNQKNMNRDTLEGEKTQWLKQGLCFARLYY